MSLATLFVGYLLYHLSTIPQNQNLPCFDSFCIFRSIPIYDHNKWKRSEIHYNSMTSFENLIHQQIHKNIVLFNNLTDDLNKRTPQIKKKGYGPMILLDMLVLAALMMLSFPSSSTLHVRCSWMYLHASLATENKSC